MMGAARCVPGAYAPWLEPVAATRLRKMQQGWLKNGRKPVPQGRKVVARRREPRNGATGGAPAHVLRRRSRVPGARSMCQRSDRPQFATLARSRRQAKREGG